MFEGRERKKYKDMFEEKFEEEVGLSHRKSDDEFYTDYLKKIEEKYIKIIFEKKNNGDTDYLEREKIIVDTNIKNLERWDFSYTSITAIISSVLVISTFGVGKMLDSSSNSVKLSIDSALKNISDPQKIQQLNNYFNNYSTDMSYLVLKFTVAMIIIIALSIIFVDQWSSRKRRNCNRKIAFNRMCLSVLNKIK